jgi:hypothetical protein
MQEMQDYYSMHRKLWSRHLREDVVPFVFPREVGFPSRTIVHSRDEYELYLAEHFSKDNCFTAVYAEFQKEHNLYDTIFMDIDMKELSDAEFNKVKRFYLKLISMDISPRIYFSGKKGFHFFIDFDLLEIPNFKSVVRKWFKMSGLSGYVNVDLGLLGEKSALSRVLATPNPSTGFLCSEINDDILSLNMRDVKRRALSVNCVLSSRVLNEIVAKQLWELSKSTKLQSSVKFPDKQIFAEDLSIYPNCIVEIIKELKTTGELEHYKRLHLAMFLNFVNFSAGQIMSLFKSYAKDFREVQTLYQVQRIKRLNLRPYGCDKARFLNMCPLSLKRLKSCPYYPSICWVLWNSSFAKDATVERTNFKLVSTDVNKKEE